MSSNRLRQSGFVASISFSLSTLDPALICFSRRIASGIEACTSYQTSSLQPYLAVNPRVKALSMLPDSMDEA
jgi:hypothetical protein